MSTPDKAVALVEFPDEELDTSLVGAPKSFESEVNEALKGMTKGDDGKMHFQDGLDERVLFAANAERRRRDTESELSKARTTAKVAEEKAAKFVERLAKGIEPTLTVEQKEELEDLKRDDPDTWRKKITEYEDLARVALEDELELDESEAQVIGEVERRAEVLQEFLNTNPELVLNDEVFENDLPPRLTKKLHEGEITFEEFLVKAKEFLVKDKPGKKTKVKSNDEEQEPNLGKAGGGSKAQDTSVEGDIISSYSKEIF